MLAKFCLINQDGPIEKSNKSAFRISIRVAHSKDVRIQQHPPSSQTWAIRDLQTWEISECVHKRALSVLINTTVDNEVHNTQLNHRQSSSKSPKHNSLTSLLVKKWACLSSAYWHVCRRYERQGWRMFRWTMARVIFWARPANRLWTWHLLLEALRHKVFHLSLNQNFSPHWIIKYIRANRILLEQSGTETE